MLRIPAFLFLFAFSVVFTSCGDTDRKKISIQKQSGGGARPPVRAEAITVSTATLFDKIEVPGTIVANEATEIHPEVPGLITGIYFKEGGTVGKGALLFKLNDRDLQAQLRKLQVQAKIARQNENRSSELLKIGGISQQDYDAAQLQVNNVTADIAIIQTQIAKTAIRAPFTGKVGLRLVSVGAYVTPATAMTTISQTGQAKIDFTVPEKYIGKVNTGQFVNFTVEGSSRNYTARIMATESNILESTRALAVRAIVVGDNGGLVPGAFARVQLNFEPQPDAIMIPTQAILPQARGKKVYVYQNGEAKFIDVTTGVRDSSQVQILSGLNVGDTLLLTGLLSLKPGANVMLSKINGKPVQGPKPAAVATESSK